MSEENVELVRKAFDDFNAFLHGELSREAVEQFADPEVEFKWHGDRTMPDQPQHLVGVPAILGFWEHMRSAWADLAIEPLEFIDAPEDRVLIFLRQIGRGRESGVPVEVHAFQVVTLRDGRVRRSELFRHRADALKAAGLSE
jgi:ketosteroid isomerase-like protein